MNQKSILLKLAGFALISMVPNSYSAVLSTGPDAWARGSVANDGSFASDYYGWDQFDAGTPGPFGNSTLDDTSPDVGIDPGGASAAQGDPAAYGLRSSSGNLYSGFQGDAFNLDLTVPSSGTAGSGSTTVLLTLVGNPATDRALLPFVLSDGVNTFSPNSVLDGLSSELILADGSRQRIWAAEWQLSGNANTYTIGIDSDLASGNGTDVAIDSVSLDVAWSASSTALANSQTPDGLGSISVVPEPSSSLLELASLVILSLRRSRRAQ